MGRVARRVALFFSRRFRVAGYDLEYFGSLVYIRACFYEVMLSTVLEIDSAYCVSRCDRER